MPKELKRLFGREPPTTTDVALCDGEVWENQDDDDDVNTKNILGVV
jgi:hypothetical protein